MGKNGGLFRMKKPGAKKLHCENAMDEEKSYPHLTGVHGHMKKGRPEIMRPREKRGAESAMILRSRKIEIAECYWRSGEGDADGKQVRDGESENGRR